MLNKYNYKKPKNQVLAKMVDKHVSEKTAERIEECNNFMAFITNCDCTKGKQVAGNSCKNRFCPICTYRLSKKDALKIHIIMKYLEDKHDTKYIMATFTAPNVKGNELQSEISRYGRAFKNLEKRKEVSKVNKGFIRKLEVTYNKEETITYDMWHGLKGKKPMGEYYERKGLRIGDDNPNYDTYHVHYHVIFAVNKSYFTSKNYIKHEEWLRLWREAMDDESITQVDIRRIKRGQDKNGDINEIAKYAAKDSDYLINQEVFDVFYKSLKGRQIITYNKLFKEAVKLYKAGELDHYKTSDTTEYVNMIYYKWGGKVYNETERRELTPREKAEYNNLPTCEVDIDETESDASGVYVLDKHILNQRAKPNVVIQIKGIPKKKDNNTNGVPP